MITVLIERHIVPGMASTYANYATQIIQASVSAPGFISGESLKGIDDSNARYIVIKIRSIQDWKNWFTSPEREKIHHIRLFGWGTQKQIDEMQRITFAVNDVLKKLFADIGILLVDYKLEFGDYEGELVLGDEFTPDGCRLWDAETRKKLDKDRFRRDMGDVVEAYEEVALRLGVPLD